MELIWETNFLKVTGKKQDLGICSTDLIKDDKTAGNTEGKKDSICFRSDLL